MLHSGRSLAARAIGATLLLLVASSTCTLRAQEALTAWEHYDFTVRPVEPEQIKDLSLDDLKFLRGIVFGKHGRAFNDSEIRRYLAGRPWFKPNPKFQNSMLNDVERHSLDVIREAEARTHGNIEPGDLRWWRTRLMTEEALGPHTGAEWRILVAEVEAIHGKRFDDEPWLQEYFDERYWYAPSVHYDPKSLTATERNNIATMLATQRKQRNLAVSPGDMGLFQNRAITADMLRGLNLYELRVMRNEVYARRGRLFRTEWLMQYFSEQPWYDPGENTYDVTLSEVEKQNVDTIRLVEGRLHEELSTKPVTPEMLDGLFLEDARKLRYEIYARHGKVFKERWLQAYFSTFDWYKADPKYSDRSLTVVERSNVAKIIAYEKEASSAVEG
jgi:hypothetical protein